MKKKERQYYSLLVPFLALCMIAILLFVKNRGVPYKTIDAAVRRQTGSKNTTQDVIEDIKCLVIKNPAHDSSLPAEEQLTEVLNSMRIAYDVTDIHDFDVKTIEKYQNIVIACPNLDPVNDEIMGIFDWVKAGGRLMFVQTLEANSLFYGIKSRLGILEGGETYEMVEKFTVSDDFMIGGNDKVFTVSEGYKSALEVFLNDKCTVYMMSEGDKQIPLLWETLYGEGKIIVNNHGLFIKAARGILAAAYSLMEDVCAYPVINTSSFFLDDFPGPVPDDDNEYITRDYNMNVADFYRNIWWPDILALGEKYNLKYSGMAIEQYSDEVSAPFERTCSTSDFKFFGGMLLNAGGELGLHGYNHMPLSLQNVDYTDYFDHYVNFTTQEDMIASLKEVEQFIQSVFPDIVFAAYVPPSNVLSAEGRAMIKDYFPEIKVIASTYFEGEIAYDQEFEVSSDGIIEFPRIVSGCNLDEFMELSAFSELNLHYVNSHFMHPDDVLDLERGADEGWERLKENFEQYLIWLYTAAPNIRDATATEGAEAIAQFDGLTVKRILTETNLRIELGGFQDSAYLLLRFNEAACGEVRGGTLEHMTGNLYLLCAEESCVDIELRR